MEKPKNGEYWHVQYGINKETNKTDKNNIIAEVLEDVLIDERKCSNWRCYSYRCRTTENPNILIHGMCFVEKYMM